MRREDVAEAGALGAERIGGLLYTLVWNVDLGTVLLTGLSIAVALGRPLIGISDGLHGPSRYLLSALGGGIALARWLRLRASRRRLCLIVSAMTWKALALRTGKEFSFPRRTVARDDIPSYWDTDVVSDLYLTDVWAVINGAPPRTMTRREAVGMWTPEPAQSDPIADIVMGVEPRYQTRFRKPSALWWRTRLWLLASTTFELRGRYWSVSAYSIRSLGYGPRNEPWWKQQTRKALKYD